MKKIGFLVLFAWAMLTGCGDGDEKGAQIHLKKAETALLNEKFSEAKLQIDSIRILYPKAFETRKKGIKLMLQVDLKEQRKALAYLDSMMLIKQNQLDSIRANFVLEKDTELKMITVYNVITQEEQKLEIISIRLRWWKRIWDDRF